MGLNGGRVAAGGFRYQYMVAVEHYLRMIRSNIESFGHIELVVEPDTRSSQHGFGDDVVDYEIRILGETHSKVQVKFAHAPERRNLQPAEATEIALKFGPATESGVVGTLRTNRPLSPRLREAIQGDLEPGASEENGEWIFNVDDSTVSISVDQRTISEIRDSIVRLVKGFRRDRALGQGEATANLVATMLVQEVFESASAAQESVISDGKFIEIMHIPDGRVAHLFSEIEWAIVSANVPHHRSQLPRLFYLDLLQHRVPHEEQRQPSLSVLHGRTGAGKSVVAADYCHHYANEFEHILWFDCSNVGLVNDQIEAQLADVPEYSRRRGEGVAVDIAFRETLSVIPGPWLVILDDAASRQAIERYIPTVGRIQVVVTSTNANGWWPGCGIEVRGFDLAEAVACFQIYAGIEPSIESDEVIQGIVDRLDCSPLAVSMAANYFANCEGDIGELSKEYFADLAALEDSLAIPPGYPRTAYSAIVHSSRRMAIRAESSFGGDARAAIEIGSVLGRFPVPMNFILDATQREKTIRLAEVPQPVEVPVHVRRAVVAAFKTESIAQRLVADKNVSPLCAECVSVHSLVREVLRENYLRKIPDEKFDELATRLMWLMAGWLSALRADQDFYGAGLLCAHSESLIDLVEERQHRTVVTNDALKFKLIAEAMLRIAIGQCYASKGRWDEAVNWGSASLDVFRSLAGDQHADRLSVFAGLTVLGDLSLAEVPVPRILEVASSVVSNLEKLAGSDDPISRETVLTHCGEIQGSISRLEKYRQSAELSSLVERIQKIREDDPRAGSRPTDLNEEVNNLWDARDYVRLSQLVPALRAASSSMEERLMITAVEIVAQLGMKQIDEAAIAVRKLCEVSVEDQYLTGGLLAALKKACSGAYRVYIESTVPDSRVVILHNILRSRYDEVLGAGA